MLEHLTLRPQPTHPGAKRILSNQALGPERNVEQTPLGIASSKHLPLLRLFLMDAIPSQTTRLETPTSSTVS